MDDKIKQIDSVEIWKVFHQQYEVSNMNKIIPCFETCQGEIYCTGYKYKKRKRIQFDNRMDMNQLKDIYTNGTLKK